MNREELLRALRPLRKLLRRIRKSEASCPISSHLRAVQELVRNIIIRESCICIFLSDILWSRSLKSIMKKLSYAIDKTVPICFLNREFWCVIVSVSLSYLRFNIVRHYHFYWMLVTPIQTVLINFFDFLHFLYTFSVPTWHALSHGKT